MTTDTVRPNRPSDGGRIRPHVAKVVAQVECVLIGFNSGVYDLAASPIPSSAPFGFDEWLRHAYTDHSAGYVFFDAQPVTVTHPPAAASCA